MNARALLVSCLLAFGVLHGYAFCATVQGTAFAYQGELRQGGNAVTGNVAMTFALYDAADGGNVVGAPITSSVPVAGGVFTVDLDFGAAAFIDIVPQARYLQVIVEGSALMPRTKIENAPYALQAQTATIAYSVVAGSIGTAEIDATKVQARVTGTCGNGTAVSAIAADGSVTCTSQDQQTVRVPPSGTALENGAALRAAVAGLAPSASTASTIELDAGTYDVGTEPLYVCAPSGRINIVGAGRNRTLITGSAGENNPVIGVCGTASGLRIERMSDTESVTSMLLFQGAAVESVDVIASSDQSLAIGIQIYGTGYFLTTADLRDVRVNVRTISGQAFGIVNGVDGGDEPANVSASNLEVVASPNVSSSPPKTFAYVHWDYSTNAKVNIDHSVFSAEIVFGGRFNSPSVLVANSRFDYQLGHSLLAAGSPSMPLCAGVVANYDFIAGSVSGTSCP